MKRILKYLILGLIVLVIGSVIVNAISAANAPKKVKTVKVRKGNLEVSVSASGKIQSKDSVDLNFTGSGRISYLPFKEGDAVKSGTILAYLDGSLIREQANKAWADYRNSLEKIREFENNNKDKPKNDTYQISKNQLEATRDSYAAIVGQTLEGYKDKTLVAPIDGTITKINGKVGETAPTTEPVLTIQNTNSVKFVSEVDEQDIGTIRVGQSAKINLDAYPRKEFSSTVEKIETVAKTGSTGNTYYPVELIIPVADDPLLVGMNGDSIINTLEKDNVLIISQDGLLEENNKTYVYVIENGVAKKKEITTGTKNDFDIEVVSGLSENDEVITSDLTILKEGTKVSE